MARQGFKKRNAIIMILVLVAVLCFWFRRKRISSSQSNKCDNSSLDLEFVEQNLMDLPQDDAQLVRYSRIKYISPPSTLPYQLSGIDGTSENHTDKFSRWVASFLKHKKNGIFIEAGAHTGAESSHTLMLEIKYSWTGLLIECNPTLVPTLRERHRKAWIADVCLSPSKFPTFSQFFNENKWTQTGRLETSSNKIKNNSSILYEVYSIPIYTLLAALGWKEIDYFALDVEGAEMEILSTIPFDLITIKILSVGDYYHIKRKMVGQMDGFLRRHGMHLVGRIEGERVYLHKSILHLLNESNRRQLKLALKWS